MTPREVQDDFESGRNQIVGHLGIWGKLIHSHDDLILELKRNEALKEMPVKDELVAKASQRERNAKLIHFGVGATLIVRRWIESRFVRRRPPLSNEVGGRLRRR